MKNKEKYKSVRMSEDTYNELRNIQHDKRYNTLKEAVEYLVNLYKGNE